MRRSKKVCDRCGNIIRDENTLEVNASIIVDRFHFETAHYDLCRDCEKKFRSFFKWRICHEAD